MLRANLMLMLMLGWGKVVVNISGRGFGGPPPSADAIGV